MGSWEDDSSVIWEDESGSFGAVWEDDSGSFGVVLGNWEDDSGV